MRPLAERRELQCWPELPVGQQQRARARQQPLQAEAVRHLSRAQNCRAQAQNYPMAGATQAADCSLLPEQARA